MTEEPNIETPAKPKFDRKKIGAEFVDKLCSKHFDPPHFCYLTQVRNGTGFTRRTTRTADAIAMGTWPSRGIHLHGIEIKVAKSDFMAELNNPAKAEEIAQYCHYWWLAISHPGVAPLELVPPNWGVIVVDENCETVTVVKKAVLKEAKAPDHPLLAAILRRVCEEYVARSMVSGWKDDLRCELEKRADENAKYIRESNTSVMKKQAEYIQKIHDVLGVADISGWGFENFKRNYALAKRLNISGPTTVAAIQRLLVLVKQFEPELESISKELSVNPLE